MYTSKVLSTPPTAVPVVVFGPALLRLETPAEFDLDASASQLFEATFRWSNFRARSDH
jgi:hypothetical protein